MIGAILDALARRVSAADAVIKTDDTLTLEMSPDGESRITSAQSQTSYLRVVREGRVGHAEATDEGIAELTGRAMQAAASGEELELLLPAPAPLPGVSTRAPHAAAAGIPELDTLARALEERLARSHRRVEVWAERSFGSVRVANTRGVLAGYESTLAGLGAVIESIGAGWAPPCRVHCSGSALPTLHDVEGLVAEVDERLDPPLLEAPPPGHPAIFFAPRAVATLLRPLRAALLGQEAWLGRSPLRDSLGERRFDPGLTLIDDPLMEGRPASRPLDDDGVPSRRLALIERGRVLNFASDLQVGARAGVPSTGHAWRAPGAAARVGFTNLRMAGGDGSRADLLRTMDRGILVEDLEWGAGPNPLEGELSLRAPWAYLVEGGEVRGRLEGTVLAGDLFERLESVAAIGGGATWCGALSLPSLVLEGFEVRHEVH